MAHDLERRQYGCWTESNGEKLSTINIVYIIAVHAGFGCLYFTERSQIIPRVEMAQDLEL